MGTFAKGAGRGWAGWPCVAVSRVAARPPIPARPARAARRVSPCRVVMGACPLLRAESFVDATAAIRKTTALALRFAQLPFTRTGPLHRVSSHRDDAVADGVLDQFGRGPEPEG